MSEYRIHKTMSMDGRRYKILNFIFEYKAQHDYSPSTREICGAVLDRSDRPCSTSVVRHHLQMLQRAGYIDYLPREARTVHLTPLGKAFMQAHTLPERVLSARSRVELEKQQLAQL